MRFNRLHLIIKLSELLNYIDDEKYLIYSQTILNNFHSNNPKSISSRVFATPVLY